MRIGKKITYERPDIPDDKLCCDICGKKPARFFTLSYGWRSNEGVIRCDECAPQLTRKIVSVYNSTEAAA